jgi:hypothetical protein
VASFAARANVVLQLEFLIHPPVLTRDALCLLSISPENPAQVRLRGGKSRARVLN